MTHLVHLVQHIHKVYLPFSIYATKILPSYPIGKQASILLKGVAGWSAVATSLYVAFRMQIAATLLIEMLSLSGIIEHHVSNALCNPFVYLCMCCRILVLDALPNQ